MLQICGLVSEVADLRQVSINTLLDIVNRFDVRFRFGGKSLGGKSFGEVSASDGK